MAVEGNGGLTHRYAHYGSCVGALGIRILRGANGPVGRVCRSRPPCAGPTPITRRWEIKKSRGAAYDLLVHKAVHIVQPEPVICGGTGEVLCVMRLAALDGVPSIPHSTNKRIGIAAAICTITCLRLPVRAWSRCRCMRSTLMRIRGAPTWTPCQHPTRREYLRSQPGPGWKFRSRRHCCVEAQTR